MRHDSLTRRVYFSFSITAIILLSAVIAVFVFFIFPKTPDAPEHPTITTEASAYSGVTVRQLLADYADKDNLDITVVLPNGIMLESPGTEEIKQTATMSSCLYINPTDIYTASVNTDNGHASVVFTCDAAFK